MPEVLRVLAASALIALAFIMLLRIEIVLVSVDRVGGPQAQAERIAEASREALAELPGEHLRVAWQIGREVGIGSVLAASVSQSPEPERRQIQVLVEQRLEPVREMAAAYGVWGVKVLPVKSQQELHELNERLDADESGLAARVGVAMSPLHRELCLLGMQVGAEEARIASNPETLSTPSARQISRRARRAGLPPALWQPLMREPAPDEEPGEAIARYLAASRALGDALARRP